MDQSSIPPAVGIDQFLFAPVEQRQPLRKRLWREWCFARVVVKRFRVRLLIMALILVGGGLLFQAYEPEKGHSLPQAIYYAWSLVFGEPPEEFPESVVLQALFFLIPVLGLTVIIEAIVDFAFIMRDRSRYEKGWCCMMASSFKDHIVLVGFGKLGFRTFGLLRELGQEVVVIERNEESQFLDDVRRDGSPLLIGDARREAMLADANVAKARAIILATNDDLANLEMALDAREMAPNIRVVLRMFDQNMADKIGHAFNMHIAMSQSSMSAPAFATAAIEPSIVTSFVVGDQLVVIQRWLVHKGGPLCGRSVSDIMVEFGFGIAERTPKGGEAILFPTPGMRLEAGDEILVQGPFKDLQALKDKTLTHLS